MTDTTDMAVEHRRSMTLGELLRIPARRWTTVLACALLGAVAALGYLTLIPASYQGTAVVVVRPVVADPFTYPGAGADRAVNMNVESGIATGSQVVDAVAAATGRRPEDARAALAVELPVGTQILRFGYTGRSADEAIRGANAAATSYLQIREKMYADQRAELLASYDETIKTATAQEAAARKTLPDDLDANAPTPPGVSATMERLRALNDQLTEVTAQRAKVAAIDVTPGTVSSLARPPIPSSRDAATLYLIVALLGGVLLGAVLTYAQESLDRRVRTLPEAEEVSGVPALATLRRGRRRRDNRRAQADLRYAAMAITERLDAATQRQVVLLSARPGEIDAALVADLAAALAGEGQAVRVEGSISEYVTPARRAISAVSGRWQALRAIAPRRVHPGSAARAAIAEPGGGYPATGRVEARATVVRRRPSPYPEQSSAVATGAGRSAPLLLEEELSVPIGGGAAPHDPVLAGPVDGDGPAARGGGDSPWTAPPPRPAPGASGRVRMRTTAGPDAGLLTLITAPPAESDENGVRAARDATAVLVVARDLTRARELGRLADRLRITGTQPLGLLFLSGRV